MHFILIGTFLLFLRVNGEKFSALSEMENLAKDEEKIIHEFEKFLITMDDLMGFFKQKLHLWKSEYKIVQHDVEKYVTHPINAYLMIKRLSIDIDELYEAKIYAAIQNFKINIEDLRPTDEDLVGAVDGLVRLQRMFKLKPIDIARGEIAGFECHNKLSKHDLVTFAKIFSDIDPTDRNSLFYLKIATMDDSSEIGEYEIFEVTKKIIKNLPRVPPKENFIKDGIYTEEEEMILYSRLCRNEGIKSPAEKAFLKCTYKSTNAFTKLAPFKVEEADRRTELVIFHDVVYDSEIEVLKSLSRLHFERGTVVMGNSSFQKSRVRTAKVAWLSDKYHKIVERITKRVEDMTGLSTKTAENLQVQNYGIGGHYNPHWDNRLRHETQDDEGTGNRIATLLFYLSTVERGGATVFPYAKVHVPPVKGTAAFWYNIRNSGEPDLYTRHAACPVLIGSKWVANKWFREYEQEFRRPCKIEEFKHPPSNDYNSEFY